jgi:CubicO group peptidase (beta-lactamase class C family)
MMFCKALDSRLTCRCFFLLLCFSITIPALAGSTSQSAQPAQDAQQRAVSRGDRAEGALVGDNHDLAAFLKAQAARGAKTRALEIYENKRLTEQFYEPPFGPSTRAQVFSVTKSLTSLAIGAAALRYELDLRGSICEWLPQARENGLCGIKLVDVLLMSSGLRWKEDYSATSADSQVLEMLYGSGALAMASYVLEQPLAAVPGSDVNYSSGDTMLLSEILNRVTDGQSRPFVQREVLDKLGIGDAIWESDRSGTLVGAASLYLSAPEMAKVGFAMLDGGATSRGSVVSPEFFRASLSPARPGVAYGYQWWLNDGGFSPGSPQQKRRWPSATPRTYAALGHWGQYLVVVPEEDLVIVRLGDDKTASFDLDGLIRIARGARVATVAPLMMVASTAANPKAPPLVEMSQTDAFVQGSEVPPVMLERALGFGAKTACSCLSVSLLPWEYCEKYLQLPNLPRLEYRRSAGAPESDQWVNPLVEARLNGFAKVAEFREDDGCVLLNDKSYKTEGPSGRKR